MQHLYASHVDLPLTAPDGGDIITAASGCLAEWLDDRFGVSVETWSAGSVALADGMAEWRTELGAAGGLLRLGVAHSDRETGAWRWHTTVWVGVENETAWIRVRIGIEAAREGAVIDPNVSVGAPRFLGVLADRVGAEIDGRRLGTWWDVSLHQVAQYVAFLESGDRRLPVVAVTRTPAGAPIHPQRLASRLTGVAHVVGVEPAATFRVSDTITPTRSVFGGAVRVYWPGFSRTADPRRHPLWLPGSGNRLATPAFADELAGLLGRTAAAVIDVPRLEATLAREESERLLSDARQLRDENRRLRQAQRDESTRAGLSAEELEEFSKELKEAEDRAEDLERQLLEAQIALEEERKSRERAEALVQTTWQQVATAQAASHGTATIVEPPATVLEAVQRASQSCPHLVFTQSAFNSAEQSQYESPETVLADLLLLEEIAQLWADGELSGGFRQAFAERHPGFRADISQTAATMYRGDYLIDYNGGSVTMGPHLRRGVGPPTTILGIYWYRDDDNKVLVVGHVGKKLRDQGNRN